MENEAKVVRVAGQPPSWLRIGLAVVVLIASLAMSIPLAFTAMDSKRESSPVPGGVETTGTVVSVREEDGTKSSIYSARIRFTDRDGVVHTFTKQAGGENPEPGSQVRVSYDPADPASARDLTTNASIWKYQLAPLVTVLVFVLGVGVWFVIWLVRKRRGVARTPPPAVP